MLCFTPAIAEVCLAPTAAAAAAAAVAAAATPGGNEIFIIN